MRTEKYERVELDIIEFQTEDIITKSRLRYEPDELELMGEESTS